MSVVTINGVEFECDFYDADFVEPFEKASKKMQERAAELQSFKGTNAESMRKLCEVVNDYFDEIFGEGTSERLFHGNHNMMDHIRAAEVLADESNKSRKEMADFANKYVQRQRSEQFKQAQASRKQIGQLQGMKGH